MSEEGEAGGEGGGGEAGHGGVTRCDYAAYGRRGGHRELVESGNGAVSADGSREIGRL